MSQPIEVIAKAKDQFISIAESSPETHVHWQKEANFAMQAITKNDFNMKAAMNNPASLRNAVINVASVGLSLNPATAYAYLVPRDNAICLDISYKGLIKIATDTGSIMWAQADIVYKNDTFQFNGVGQLPTHKTNPFDVERGEVVGAYCVAKTHDGDYLTEIITEAELQDIKSKSKSANSAYSPWNTFPNEMRKKAVIKRASKTWPNTDRNERLSNVIEYVNQEEGIEFDDINEEDRKLFNDYVHQRNGAAIQCLLNDNADYWGRVQSTFYEKGKITSYKAMIRELIDEAFSYIKSLVDSIQTCIESESIEQAQESYNEMNEHELKMFWKFVDANQKILFENNLEVA